MGSFSISKHFKLIAIQRNYTYITHTIYCQTDQFFAFIFTVYHLFSLLPLSKSLNLMWKIDPSIDVNRVSLEDVKFVFSQAEKRLDDTVKTGESIASKTMSMITLMAGVLIALSGYTISDWKGLAFATDKDVVAVLGSLYILGLLQPPDRKKPGGECWKMEEISILRYFNFNASRIPGDCLYSAGMGKMIKSNISVWNDRVTAFLPSGCGPWKYWT